MALEVKGSQKAKGCRALAECTKNATSKTEQRPGRTWQRHKAAFVLADCSPLCQGFEISYGNMAH